MRGRNNNNNSNNRKGPNPLTRSWESNGPDVKVRGTAQHIAEKYLQLARDAQSSGDPVMAESYLQHAEHYYRLIAAAHAAQQAHLSQQMGQPRPPAEIEYDDDEEDVINDRFASVAERLPPPQFPPAAPPPQPVQQPYQERPNFGGDRPQQPDRQDRPPRHERPYQDRNQGQQGQNFNRDNRGNRDNPRFRDQRPADQQAESRQPDEPREPRAAREPQEEPVGLPAFITAPPRPLPADAPQPDIAVVGGEDQPDAGGYHLRPRRRRRGRPGLVTAEGGEASPESTDGGSDAE